MAMLGIACTSDRDTPVDSCRRPDSVPEAQLTFLRPDTGVVLRTDSVAFWAVKGQNREVDMYYRPPPVSTDRCASSGFECVGEVAVAPP